MVKKLEDRIVIGYDSTEEMEEGRIDDLLNGSLFWNDVYLEFAEDVPYLVDYNEGKAYNLFNIIGYAMGNCLNILHEAIVKAGNALELYVDNMTDEEFTETFCGEE